MIEMSAVMSTPDLLLQDMFDLYIPVIPGGGDGQALMVRNLTASLPGHSNNIVKQELHRHVVNFSGKRQFKNSFPASFVDAVDRKVIDALRNWQNKNTDPNTGLPNSKSAYATTGVVTIYGPGNVVVEQRTYYGLWISDVPDVSLTGNSDSPLNINPTFTYDYYKS